MECLPARGACAATLLGPFGEFFRSMELGRTAEEAGAGLEPGWQNLEKVRGAPLPRAGLRAAGLSRS